MTGRRRVTVLFGILMLWAVHGALAHHSVAGEFDQHKIVKLNGVVSDVEWANPHVYLHFDVREPNGTVTAWRLASVPTAMMRKAGLTKALLLANGQSAVVDAYPARDGTRNLAYIVKITYADGHHFQFAPDSTGPSP
jgi:hypothetical protein